MATQRTEPARYDRFERTLEEYGVGVRRVRPAAVRETIESLRVGSAVGTPLDIEGAALPESVTTGPTTAELEAAETGVTSASLAIAEYGSVVLRATAEGSEPISLFNDRHVVVLREGDIVPDMASAFEWFGEELRETRDSAIIATGPSATADMGALVQGAHGPKEVEVIVVS
ncbi:LutC/YkgG family protein [Natronomonas sp.]|uniref:LutC/YkgG family protein n=1 Tax=Natronomonas sp. TaxID=2184060 RepID=UPI00261AE7B0|nr:LUD domain-containing protein [Natronomonas sp.]